MPAEEQFRQVIAGLQKMQTGIRTIGQRVSSLEMGRVRDVNDMRDTFDQLAADNGNILPNS